MIVAFSILYQWLRDWYNEVGEKQAGGESIVNAEALKTETKNFEYLGEHVRD